MSSFICIVLAIIQFVVITTICVLELRRKSCAVFLWSTLLLMFGIMHFYSAFSRKIIYSESVLNQASLFVILFCGLYLITRLSLSKLSTRMNDTFSYGKIAEEQTIDTGFLLFVFVAATVLMSWNIIRYSGGLLNTSWASGRAYASTLDYVNSNQLYKILFFSLSGLSLYYWIKKKRKLSITVLGLILFLEIATRNRIYVLPFILFFLSIVVYKIKNLRLKHIVIAVVGAIIIIYIIYGLRVFRHYGSIQDFISSFDLSEFTDRIMTYIETDNGELGLRTKFYYFIQNNNRFPGFGSGAGYIRILLVYIPTNFSLGLKPDDFAQTMGAAIGMVEGGSTHPTLFGDCYANLGWAGVLLGVFWAFICSVADALILMFRSYPYRICAFVLVSTCLVIIGRGSAYNAFHIMAWGIPILFLFQYVHRKTRRIRIVIKK